MHVSTHHLKNIRYSTTSVLTGGPNTQPEDCHPSHIRKYPKENVSYNNQPGEQQRFDTLNAKKSMTKDTEDEVKIDKKKFLFVLPFI